MSGQNGVSEKTIIADFCVVGGGLAGLCAAISAARGGSRVVLMQERPMLGGNASSEIRMWVCGAGGENNRATGIIEEIELENYYRNPEKNYYLWDSVLFEKAKAEKNLILLLNCSCFAAKTEDGIIRSVTGWQMTTETRVTVEAALFADCSGDSILAPLTGADFRFGRESAEEFHEKIGVVAEDKKTMGMSCLIQGRLTDQKHKFVPPKRIVHMTPEMIRLRKPNLSMTSENFWYLELGGDRDSIRDTETVRDELIALALGMWDYIKNSGEVENADYWDLEFLGFLPGKRESRRMMGPYLMTQNDVLAGGMFEDTVGFGGWPLDDHPPEGFYHPGDPNFCITPPSPYGIPYRVLYSRNVKNLFFAGRNISMTHAAMSSSRVMATCAILGEAVGTAADLAREFCLSPAEVGEKKIRLLQERLMENGCFLPYRRREIQAEALSAALSGEASDDALSRLRNGTDRNNRTYGEDEQGCILPIGKPIVYRFDKPLRVENVHLAFDSDLDRKTLPGDSVERLHSMRANLLPDSPVMYVPKTLIRSFALYGVLESGEEVLIDRWDDFHNFYINIPIHRELCGLRFLPLSTWGESENVHIFSFDFRCESENSRKK